MHAMHNTKVIEAIEKFSLQKYLEKLMDADLRKVTLFTRFPHTSAPNISDPHYFVLVNDLSKIIAMNGGCYFN